METRQTWLSDTAMNEILEVRKILGQARRIVIRGHFQHRPRFLLEIAQVQVRAGDREAAELTVEKCLELASGIAEAEHRAIVLWTIVHVQAEDLADLEGALHTASIIKNVYYKDDALRAMAIMKAHAGHFEEAFKAAHAIADEKHKARAFREIAVIRERRGGAQAMTMSELIGKRLSALLDGNIAAARKGGDSSLAVASLRRKARQIAATDEVSGQSARTLGWIAAHQSMLGDKVGADESWKMLLQIRNSCDLEERPFCLYAFAHSYATVRDLQEVLSLLAKESFSDQEKAQALIGAAEGVLERVVDI